VESLPEPIKPGGSVSDNHPREVLGPDARLALTPAVTTCPSCGGADSAEFFHESRIPTNSVAFFEDRSDAIGIPQGSLRLRACRDCGVVWNSDFDPALARYGAHHEESQGYSGHFAEFAAGLAEEWAQRYGLRDGRVIEVGCGKAEFLAMFCTTTGASGIGIDPAARLDRVAESARSRLTLVTESFDERSADVAGDALICRHTLEHIPDVGVFLGNVGRWAERHPGAPVLFELPDVQRVFDEVAFWDVYYEHCSYFTQASLVAAFERAGLAVLDCRLVYDDQYLVIEAVAGDREAPVPGAGASVLESGRRFASAFVEQTAQCEANLAVLARDGSKVAIWGASSKGSALLNTIGSPDRVAYAVDINPNMRGKHMVGTGHQVRAPRDMVDDPVGSVIVMNPVYRAEIAATLESLGLAPRLFTINELLTTQVAA
jgi:hypothetical protein